MTALREATAYGLFDEFKSLGMMQRNDFNQGRYMLYDGISDMVIYDTERGDRKLDLTPEDQIYWEHIAEKIKNSVELLASCGGMRDQRVWACIPPMFHGYISAGWNGIGDWQH